MPDHRQPVHRGRFDDLTLPVTERLCAEVLSVPCHPALDDDDVDQVAAALDAFRGAGRSAAEEPRTMGAVLAHGGAGAERR
ncbi:DegT/DnrJ/EryC1/StrS family aminotransferase [Dactylosporangium sp. NPDC050688]|uniref:DegT/DnrJ/EryC1/StrS family aminotransferase n=1 Tax=Dactylosporangium sp. NPDC050688 TaxID=3157217 RepID=UPI0034040292